MQMPLKITTHRSTVTIPAIGFRTIGINDRCDPAQELDEVTVSLKLRDVQQTFLQLDQRVDSSRIACPGQRNNMICTNQPCSESRRERREPAKSAGNTQLAGHDRRITMTAMHQPLFRGQPSFDLGRTRGLRPKQNTGTQRIQTTTRVINSQHRAQQHVAIQQIHIDPSERLSGSHQVLVRLSKRISARTVNQQLVFQTTGRPHPHLLQKKPTRIISPTTHDTNPKQTL